jgi:hypothetical protein
MTSFVKFAATRDILYGVVFLSNASFSNFVSLKQFIISTVNRSPSASTIYRHHTPPKELPQFTQHNNGNGNGNPESDFVVHRSKGITTLFNMGDPLIPAKLRQAKEKTNNDSKSEERGKHRVALVAFKSFFLIHIFMLSFSTQLFLLFPSLTLHVVHFVSVSTNSQFKGDVPAGRPSNWEHQRQPTFAGRCFVCLFVFSFLITMLSLSP